MASHSLDPVPESPDIEAMSTITFDTLRLARKLEEAGFSREQASGAAEALADSLGDSVVTRTDLHEELRPIRDDITALKVELAMVKWMVGGTFFGMAMLLIRSFWTG